MIRVAVDLLGGDHAPDAVVRGAQLAQQADPGVQVILVGPVDVAQPLLAGTADTCRLFPASQVVEMDEDPARAVRAKRDATVRVAAQLIRDGDADAMVSVGSTGAALTAAVVVLRRLPGMSRPALAVVVPARAGPLVLLDAGATAQGDVDRLVQYALVGAAYAQVCLGVDDPRVGLLNLGEEAGKGDQLRREAFAALSALPLRFVGNVEGCDIPHGGRADVVVTDGFTGNVLLKGLEGAASMLGEVLHDAFLSTPERRAAAQVLLPAMAEATARLSAEHLGGGVLLGVNGVVVVGHGAAGPRAVASCISVAAQAVRERLVPRLTGALAQLVDRRRHLAASGTR